MSGLKHRRIMCISICLEFTNMLERDIRHENAIQRDIQRHPAATPYQGCQNLKAIATTCVTTKQWQKKQHYFLEKCRLFFAQTERNRKLWISVDFREMNKKTQMTVWKTTNRSKQLQPQMVVKLIVRKNTVAFRWLTRDLLKNYQSSFPADW